MASLRKSQAEMFVWLKQHGPATQVQMASGLGWSITKIKTVLYSHPEWLIAVGSVKTKFTGIATLYHSVGEHQFGWCPKCKRKNFHASFVGKNCIRCSRGEKPTPSPIECVNNLDGSVPVNAKPGSEGKLEMLMARYEQGLDLWNGQDADYEGDDECVCESEFEDEDDDAEI